MRAISIGSVVPRGDFEAVVHSAFRNAANVRVEGNPVLLTLLSSGDIDLPQGVRLDAPAGFTLENLRAGAHANCRDGVLDLDRSLIVDLRQAREWKCDLRSASADVTDPAVAVAWRHAWDALNRRRAVSASSTITGDPADEESACRSLVSRRMNDAIGAILEVTRQTATGSVGKLAALVGLGPGLTPAGDDLLTGYLAGLWCTTRGKAERETFLAALGKTVIRLSRRTNDIARTYLCLAARGQVSSTLVNLAAAIGSGEGRERVVRKAEAAMQFGHTSGTEAVNGLLLGLAAWDGPHLLATALTNRACVDLIALGTSSVAAYGSIMPVFDDARDYPAESCEAASGLTFLRDIEVR